MAQQSHIIYIAQRLVVRSVYRKLAGTMKLLRFPRPPENILLAHRTLGACNKILELFLFFDRHR
jgi:hypothetical protein